MAIKHLLCPQCGIHRLFVRNTEGRDVFFHVNPDGAPFPTEQSKADLAGLDFSEIRCVGCSWKGPIRKLVRYFTG
jgi:hypothetical protein